MNQITTRDVMQKIGATALGASLVFVPMIVRAHGGVDDGDGAVEGDGHHAGESALLDYNNIRWWYVLATAILLGAGLSRLVYGYLKVPPVTKKTATPEKK